VTRDQNVVGRASGRLQARCRAGRGVTPADEIDDQHAFADRGQCSAKINRGSGLPTQPSVASATNADGWPGGTGALSSDKFDHYGHAGWHGLLRTGCAGSIMIELTIRHVRVRLEWRCGLKFPYLVASVNQITFWPLEQRFCTPIHQRLRESR